MRLVHVLTVGAALEDYTLFTPVPHSQGVVGLTTKGDKLITGGGELNVGVGLFSSFAQDAVDLVARVLPNVDVGVVSLLSDCKVTLRLVHGNAANTVGVETIVGLDLFCVQVVGLVLVTGHIDDQIILEEVHIVALGRLLRHQVVETNVTTRNF